MARVRKAMEERSRAYSAPALEKGLDILELLARTETPLSHKEIGGRLGRSVGEIYRMLTILMARNYITAAGDSYHITTKLFELAHHHPPTNRLIMEARPIMEKLANEVDQACHLTVYGQGRQIVIAKVDVPNGMGYSVRLGSELEVIISVSGRVLLAFQDEQTRSFWIKESLQRRPKQRMEGLERRLDAIRARGYESAPSTQIGGLHGVSFPILDTRGQAIAALTVPYTHRTDLVRRKTVEEVEHSLTAASRQLCERLGGASAHVEAQTPTPKKRARSKAET